MEGSQLDAISVVLSLIVDINSKEDMPIIIIPAIINTTSINNFVRIFKFFISSLSPDFYS